MEISLLSVSILQQDRSDTKTNTVDPKHHWLFATGSGIFRSVNIEVQTIFTFKKWGPIYRVAEKSCILGTSLSELASVFTIIFLFHGTYLGAAEYRLVSKLELVMAMTMRLLRPVERTSQGDSGQTEHLEMPSLLLLQKAG